MTKLAIPKNTTVEIMGHTWEVVYEEYSEEDMRTFGETDHYLRTITIYLRPHRDYPARGPLAQTLLHECMHAALNSSGVTHSISKEEEAVVTALEHALWPLVNTGVFE